MLAIIGATGNVGSKLVELLVQRAKISTNKIELFASSRSSGTHQKFGDYTFPIYDLSTIAFSQYKIVIFCTSASVSAKFVPMALDQGCIVIDGSSQFRMQEDVPLLVPPLNNYIVKPEHKLFATANCIASPLCIVLDKLLANYEILEVYSSTYQSVSGAGAKAMTDLVSETKAHCVGQSYDRKYFHKQIAFNFIPVIDSINADGTTMEETKIRQEVNKILGQNLDLVVTSVRVATKVGHGNSLTIKFASDVSIATVEKILANCQDLMLADPYASVVDAMEQTKILVSRLRQHSPNKISLFICSDNLLRGAAYDLMLTFEYVNNFLQI